MTAAASELAMIGPPVQRSTVKFHLSLNVADLDRSVAFFRFLFDSEPAKCRPDYAKFELDEPPVVLSLEPHAPMAGGALNHLGFRLADSETLVAWQQRLEMAGIPSQREEGVECCYARQTKFWVRDPDNNLWEIYVLEEDIDHRGAGQSAEQLPQVRPGNSLGAAPSRNATSSSLAKAMWQHQLGTPLPSRIFCLDGSTAEVRLRGSFNAPHSASARGDFLAEVKRILEPGGTVHLHLLTGEQPLAFAQGTLPGPAALVEYVPVLADVLASLSAAGFDKIEVTKLGAPACFTHAGVGMRETMIVGSKPTQAN
jgi:catechol 2,3-dioxygenase-like lactoylglutathione lyase family enzyme